LRQAKVGEAKIDEAKPEDPKARLRTLKGLELAYELAKNGDQEMAGWLKRYQDGMLSPQNDTYVMKFIKKRIDEVAAKNVAKLLAEK